MNDRAPLPISYRMLNRLGDWFRISKLPLLQFQEEVVCEAAREKTGLTDFGKPYFREGLQRLLRSLEEDTALNSVGRFGLHGMIVTQLMNRLYFAEAQKRRPGEYKADLIPPFVICGLPRSGTTFLQRLLCSDPNHRGIPFWELMRPIPLTPAAERRRLAERALDRRRRLTPELDRIHHVDASSSEECMWMLSMTFTSHAYWVAAPVYGYLEWLGSQTRQDAYQEFRSLLSHFQLQENRRRLVLKAPSHAGSLRELHAVVPNAMVIQLVRDPVEVWASFSSLLHATHRAVVEKVETCRLARANLSLLLTEMERNLSFREHSTQKVFDLTYRRLVADPVGEARNIYQFFGLSWTAAAETALQRFVERNPKHRYGRHHYSTADWGIPERQLRSLFQPFVERYLRLRRFPSSPGLR